MKRGRERGEPFSPSRERSELSIFLITLHTPLSTVLKSTRPTASGPPRSSGDLRSRASRSAREAELARLIEKRLEVRGKRLEERRDLDLHTSNLIPLTSVPPRRERSELSIFLITLHAPRFSRGLSRGISLRLLPTTYNAQPTAVLTARKAELAR